jgi:alpha-amylase
MSSGRAKFSLALARILYYNGNMRTQVSKHHTGSTLLSLIAVLVVLLSTAYSLSPARAGVMLQGFYWDVPSPGAGNANVPYWWDKLAGEANSLKQAGFTAIWVPPVWKGASGGYSNGYDPFDDYDLGSKDQQFTYPTRYGTREKLQRACAMMRANGLEIYLDIVLNHRNGDPGNYSFQYRDAYGNFNAGRFAKGTFDFHPHVPQDPNVPDYWEDFGLFGRDLAPMQSSWVYNGLREAGDWVTKALDLQGYRLDYPKGVSTDYVRDYLNYGAMANKFAVGEFFDYNTDLIDNWVWGGTWGRSTAFDFPLRGTLKAMCNGGGFFDMRQLDRAGFVARSPSHAVTFVENHDTDRHDPVSQNKALAYAYILTAEGYPCVFYKDYSTDPGCYGLKPVIDNLIWIHENLAFGSTQERWKDDDVFCFERQNYPNLLVGLNDNGASSRTVTVQTGFGGNVQLHDYTGHSGDVWTNANGQVTITIPANAGGMGYVCYSRTGISGSFNAPQLETTQEYAGAQDLDIRPADNTQITQVCRIWAQTGKTITAEPYYDTANWLANTNIYFELLNPVGQSVASKVYLKDGMQGSLMTYTPLDTGWHTVRVRSFNTPASNLKPKYWLKLRYAAPQSFFTSELTSPQITYTRYPPRDNPTNYVEWVMVRNKGTRPLAGPLHIAITNLSAGATLTNRSGTTHDGQPYINAPNVTIQPGGAVMFQVRLSLSRRGGRINYTPRVSVPTY